MRFPLQDQLDLPCVLKRVLPGQLHPDGRRYLPTIVLELDNTLSLAPTGFLLGVVDRHHRVSAAFNQRGRARLICALSTLRLQQPPFRQGLLPEPSWRADQLSRAPLVLGRVAAVAAWEVERGNLPYESLYAELLLELGGGTLGLRTSLTAPDLAAAIGAATVQPGDYVELERSRIDILSFTPDEAL